MSSDMVTVPTGADTELELSETIHREAKPRQTVTRIQAVEPAARIQVCTSVHSPALGELNTTRCTDATFPSGKQRGGFPIIPKKTCRQPGRSPRG